MQSNFAYEFMCWWLQLKSFVKIFPGVEHGWTVRYDESDEHAVEEANEAHKLMIDWFAKYL